MVVPQEQGQDFFLEKGFDLGIEDRTQRFEGPLFLPETRFNMGVVSSKWDSVD